MTKLIIGNLCNNAQVGEFNKLVGQATDVALIEILSNIPTRRYPTSPPPLYLWLIRHTPVSQKPPSRQIVNGWVLSRNPHLPTNEGEWFIKGAVEEILTRCDTYISSRSTIVLDEKIRAKNSIANE